jgi:peptidoglycan/LPS O-acetylase OafA/YrhL
MDVAPGQPPTYIPPQSEIVRYGPGVPASVPASQAGPEAERVWRTGRLPEPSRRPLRLRRLFGSALTVILLAASGVVLYLHFHHAPFHVTGVAIVKQTKNGCVDDVTGRITTNGAAGTVSYQWVFRPGQQAPQPLSQSVVGGQPALYVTAAVEGQVHGSASQTATLQVLGPDQRTASTAVIVRC